MYLHLCCGYIYLQTAVAHPACAARDGVNDRQEQHGPGGSMETTQNSTLLHNRGTALEKKIKMTIIPSNIR